MRNRSFFNQVICFRFFFSKNVFFSYIWAFFTDFLAIFGANVYLYMTSQFLAFLMYIVYCHLNRIYIYSVYSYIFLKPESYTSVFTLCLQDSYMLYPKSFVLDVTVE